MQKQRDVILAALQQGYSITPIEALTMCGCMRLGARIWELKRLGYNIETKIIKTATGKRVASYRLKEKTNDD